MNIKEDIGNFLMNHQNLLETQGVLLIRLSLYAGGKSQLNNYKLLLITSIT